MNRFQLLAWVALGQVTYAQHAGGSATYKRWREGHDRPYNLHPGDVQRLFVNDFAERGPELMPGHGELVLTDRGRQALEDVDPATVA